MATGGRIEVNFFAHEDLSARRDQNLIKFAGLSQNDYLIVIGSKLTVISAPADGIAVP